MSLQLGVITAARIESLRSEFGIRFAFDPIRGTIAGDAFLYSFAHHFVGLALPGPEVVPFRPSNDDSAWRRRIGMLTKPSERRTSGGGPQFRIAVASAERGRQVESHAVAGQAAAVDPPGRSQVAPVRRSESHFRGHRDIPLFRRSWLPDRAVRAVALVHGFGEHSGRYDHLGAWFARCNTAVYSFDLRGHGRSAGRRGHVDGFSDYLNDLDIFLEQVSEEAFGLPVTLIGHSLGGLIVTALAVERSPRVQSVVTSGAALELSPALSRSKILLARLLCKVAPRLAVNAGLDPAAICSDSDVVKRYLDDPLVHGTSTTSHAVAMVDQIARLRGAGARVDVPMFLAHGALDRLCLVRGSQSFYQSLPGSVEGLTAPRAELRIYPQSFHEIFNDLEREEVFADVLDWIERCEKDDQAGTHDVQ